MKKFIVFLMFMGILGFSDAMLTYSQTLVTPSVSSVFDVSGATSHTFYVRTTQVSTNVTYQLEGSPDGTNWANIDDASTVFSASSVTSNTMYHKDNYAIALMRFNWLSKSGVGTTPNIKFNYVGRRSK